MNEEFIRIARISDAHALKGAVKIEIITDINERFTKGSTVFIELSGVMKEYVIESFSAVKNTGIITLAGVTDRNASEALKGRYLFITRAQAEDFREQLDDDEFYYYDLIACRVFMDGAEFGVIDGITESGTNLLVIKKGDKEYLLPFVESMVHLDRLSEKIVDITPVPGLFDE